MVNFQLVTLTLSQFRHLGMLPVYSMTITVLFHPMVRNQTIQLLFCFICCVNCYTGLKHKGYMIVIYRVINHKGN